MIELKALESKDVDLFYNWINDDEVIRYSLSIFQKLFSKAEIEQWYEKLLNDSKNLNLGLYLKENGCLIGYAGICNISKMNKSGEYFIFIGDKTQWGRGISTEVTKNIVKIGFDELDLHRIYLSVSEPNIGGLKSYKKAGFKEEGILRDAAFREGRFHNKIVMSILKME